MQLGSKGAGEAGTSWGSSSASWLPSFLLCSCWADAGCYRIGERKSQVRGDLRRRCRAGGRRGGHRGGLNRTGGPLRGPAAPSPAARQAWTAAAPPRARPLRIRPGRGRYSPGSAIFAIVLFTGVAAGMVVGAIVTHGEAARSSRGSTTGYPAPQQSSRRRTTTTPAVAAATTRPTSPSPSRPPSRDRPSRSCGSPVASTPTRAEPGDPHRPQERRIRRDTRITIDPELDLDPARGVRGRVRGARRLAHQSFSEASAASAEYEDHGGGCLTPAPPRRAAQQVSHRINGQGG